jgi:hypothetical protein
LIDLFIDVNKFLFIDLFVLLVLESAHQQHIQIVTKYPHKSTQQAARPLASVGHWRISTKTKALAASTIFRNGSFIRL